MQNESKFDFKYLKRQGKKRDRRLALVLALKNKNIHFNPHSFCTLTLFFLFMGETLAVMKKNPTRTHMNAAFQAKLAFFLGRPSYYPYIFYICSKFLTCRTMHICIPLIWLPAEFPELYWSSGSHGSHPYLRLLRISPLTIAL